VTGRSDNAAVDEGADRLGASVVRREVAALRATVEEGRSMPMSASVVVHRADLLAGLDRLEGAVSSALATAGDVVTARDEVVAEGEAIALEIVRQAELERDRLVSDTEVFRLARAEAEQAVGSARAEAESLRAEAEQYLERRLAQFEHTLDRTLGEVRRGIANLTGRSALAAPDDDVLLPAPEAG